MSKLLFRCLPFDMAVRRLVGRAVAGETKTGRPTLLCMNRAVFASDLAAMAGRVDLNFVAIRAAEFEAIMSRFVPRRDQVQTYFQRAYDASPADRRDRLRAAASAILKAIHARHPFDAVVVGNTDYWQDAPLMEATREMGVPFLALCRENYAVPETQTWMMRHIEDSGYVFRGDGVAVASDITRDVFLRSGAYSDDAVTTVGWPRFDSWRDPNPHGPTDRDLITLVSYHEPLYLGPENYRDVLHAFVSAARASGEPGRFVIKLKKLAHLKAVLSICPAMLTSRIRIVARQPLDELLRQSRMVIGYNTTGVLEGYLTDAAVVVPWWKDAVRPPDDTLISKQSPEDRLVTHFPETPQAFRTLLDQAVRAPLPVLGTPAERRSRFQRFVAFDPNESASAKFEAFVRSHIARVSRAGPN